MKKSWWIGMEKVKEILRLWELGTSKTGIGRAVGVHRVTVRDYLSRAQSAGISYARVQEMSSEELRRAFEKGRTGRQIKDTKIDYVHIQRELSRKGVTLLLLWEEYLRENPEGYGYSQFCNLFREWRKGTQFSMRQQHRAGEGMFVDYAGQKMEVVDRETGEVREVVIFVSVLGASNYIFAEATVSQALIYWLGSHVRALQYYGGVPEKIVPDNLKSGVKSPCRYDPELNPSYRDFAEHYQVAILPTRPYKPKDKAKVENAVQVIERRVLARLRDTTFYSIAELNEAIGELLKEANRRKMQGYDASRQELFENLDKPALKPLPQTSYRFAAWKKAKVNIDYHIEVKRHYYSVPYQLIHQKVDVRISEKTIEVFSEGQRIALHARASTPGRHTTIKEHMPPSHQYMQEWTPSRLISWAETIGPQTKIQINSLLLSREHPEHAYRACLGLLSLARKYGNERLESACARANHFGIVSMRSVKSMLKTGTDKLSLKKEKQISLFHSNIRGDTEFH